MFNTEKFFSNLIKENKAGKGSAICSVCSSNSYVIAAAMRQCERTGKPLLVEATANQVNQFGGYTGMKPADFIVFVKSLAKEVGFDAERIIFGGDHLGPLVWCAENEDDAMEKAEELVASYVSAGFVKIHIDCSMRLGSDSKTETLSPVRIAERAARLARICENALPFGTTAVYVVGSEVPIPGGATSHEDTLAVTTPDAVREELELFKRAFASQGLDDAWKRVIAIVVQPGVEFGDNQVFLYDHNKAERLIAYAASIETIALEGHSTDYQPRECLNKMKCDGIAILKVGPALTFAMRNALFALEEIEKSVYFTEPAVGFSNFSNTLEKAMLNNPQNWIMHYHGDENALALMRKFSLSDRCRYYLDDEDVKKAIIHLLANVDAVQIPIGVLAQFFPRQCEEIIAGKLVLTSKNLVYRQIEYALDAYEG